MARAQQLQRFLDPDGSPDITWLHSHNIIRGYKVILNVYDIFSPSCNCEPLVVQRFERP